MHRGPMDATTSTQPTSPIELQAAKGRHPRPLASIRQHHHERHAAACRGLDEFFANLTILLGFPSADPQAVRIRTDRARR